MGSNLLLFGKRRMPDGTYGVVRGVREISPPTRLLCLFIVLSELNVYALADCKQKGKPFGFPFYCV